MVNQLGIVQGRLTQSPPGKLQWFPQKVWRKEFTIAADVGLRYIEFIAERVHNPRNPLWSDAGIKHIKAQAKKYQLHTEYLCNDYVIDHSLIKSKDAVEQTKRLISQGRKLGVRQFILPLLERSELRQGNASVYKPILKDLADCAKHNGMMLCLETDVSGRGLLRLFAQMKHPNIKAVFDTGNRAALGQDIYSDIVLLGKAIGHVHIKDKNECGENVLLGTGLVDFRKAMMSLSKIKYAGAFTFETARGADPVRTAQYNRALIEFFIRDIKGK